jgi:hypothetical protein
LSGHGIVHIRSVTLEARDVSWIYLIELRLWPAPVSRRHLDESPEDMHTHRYARYAFSIPTTLSCPPSVVKPGAKNGNRDRGKILWQSCWIAWSIQHGIYTIQDNVTTDNKETRYNT